MLLDDVIFFQNDVLSVCPSQYTDPHWDCYSLKAVVQPHSTDGWGWVREVPKVLDFFALEILRLLHKTKRAGFPIFHRCLWFILIHHGRRFQRIAKLETTEAMALFGSHSFWGRKRQLSSSGPWCYQHTLGQQQGCVLWFCKWLLYYAVFKSYLCLILVCWNLYKNTRGSLSLLISSLAFILSIGNLVRWKNFWHVSDEPLKPSKTSQCNGHDIVCPCLFDDFPMFYFRQNLWPLSKNFQTDFCQKVAYSMIIVKPAKNWRHLRNLGGWWHR